MQSKQFRNIFGKSFRTRRREKIIYCAVTDDYKGYMIFAFENGKVAKIDLKSYETKTNRKKLAMLTVMYQLLFIYPIF